MFAWILLLLLWSTAVALAADSTVSVYLRDFAGTSPSVLAAMKGEIETLLTSAGLRTAWWTPLMSPSQGKLMVMDLQGVCEISAAKSKLEPISGQTALASTSVVEGLVTPFARVDCDAVSRYVGPGLTNINSSLRSFIYGRALGRVVAHELYHMVGQTLAHSHGGVGRPEFSVSELISPSFDFEKETVAAIRLGAWSSAASALHNPPAEKAK